VPIDNPAATLGAGDMIGELAALAALKQDRLKRPKFYPRSATVRAKTEVEALEMLPNILNNVLYNSPAFKEKLNKNYRTRALDNHFRSIPVFHNVSQDFLDKLRDRVELVDVQPGQVICRQGDVADAFYLIRLGFVKVTQDFPGGEMVLTYLSRGAYFGEMGLLPPAYRIRARGGAGEIAEELLYKDSLICGRSPLSGLATTWDGQLSPEHIELTTEGGQVRVRLLPGVSGTLTFRMQQADSFVVPPGESFLAGNTTFEVQEDAFLCGRRTATCTAMDYVQLVRITAADFAGMLAQFPEVETAITKVAQERRQMDLGLRNRVQTVSLNDFLKQELMQGQNLLLIDLTKCTRCDECVKACVATHDDGVTRLIRDGLRFDKYLAPTSCRACMDPLCMTRCPVGSIRRKDSLDIVIEDWCIGCGNCAIDCPYGNINVVELTAKSGRGQKAEPKPKAVVCDLCVEYGEPNCVRACPHDAALRVEPKKFFARELEGLRVAVTSRPVATPSHDAWLKVLAGPGAGATLQLRFPATTFGASDGNDYRFDDNARLSPSHCTIVHENGRFVLRDLGSAEGTLVNGNPVAEIELRTGDVAQFGEMRVEFHGGATQ